MTIEEYMKMSSSEQLSYRLSLSNEQRDELQKNVLRYLFKQNFTATQDEVLDLCEETKKKHNCSSECAAKLVGLTLQKMLLDELKRM